MPSSYTPNLRFEQQFTGENVNNWGVLLNAVLQRIEDAIAGLEAITLTANYTLTTANGGDDQARNMILKFAGTGSYTVTIPSVPKIYIVWNNTSGALVITTGAGSTVTLPSGEISLILCDGSNVKPVMRQDMGGNRLTNVGSPTAATDAVTKGYVDLQTFTMAAGQLPAQSGSAGALLTTNGNVASWSNTVSSLTATSIKATPADGAVGLFVTGSSKGLRILPNAAGTAVLLEGVDNTATAYQPLILGGSQVSISLSGGTAQPVATQAFATSFTTTYATAIAVAFATAL